MRGKKIKEKKKEEITHRSHVTNHDEEQLGRQCNLRCSHGFSVVQAISYREIRIVVLVRRSSKSTDVLLISKTYFYVFLYFYFHITMHNILHRARQMMQEHCRVVGLNSRDLSFSLKTVVCSSLIVIIICALIY